LAPRWGQAFFSDVECLNIAVHCISMLLVVRFDVFFICSFSFILCRVFFIAGFGAFLKVEYLEYIDHEKFWETNRQ
jgi:hypothetical protein